MQEVLGNLTKQVAETVVSSGPIVTKTVIDILAKREINKRVDAVVSGIEKQETLRRELNKFKPDVIAYNVDGTLAHSYFSKSILESKEKVEKDLEKISKAINTALEQNDFNQIFNLTKQNKDSEK